MTVKNAKGIKEIQCPDGTKKGENTTETTIEYEVTKNGTYTFKVIDNENKEETRDIIIDKIDKDAPTSCAITAKVNDEGAIEITATAVDAGSGIGKYEYYVNGEKKEESDKNTYKVEKLASGTYSVYVIAYDKAGNSKQSDPESNLKISRTYTNITAQMVAEHPETYYGLKVTNYESTNGQGDWKIFYSDGDHIFLITGDYVDLSVANRLNPNTGMTKIGDKYMAHWNQAPSSLQTVEDTVKTRFKATEYTLNSSNKNSRCVSTLLNTSNWESYKDNGNMAEYAVGGSTIEMWMASWNELCDKKYNKPSDKLYCNNTNSTGYYVGTSSKPTSWDISTGEMKAKDGYNNSLYYPHHGDVEDGVYVCNYYWLASPPSYTDHNILCVMCKGMVGLSSYNNTRMVLRPVVSLNSGIKVNATDSE